MIVFSAIMISCQDNKIDEKTGLDVKSEKNAISEVPVNNEFTFLETTPERKFPLTDSTNFDNFFSDKFLNQRQLDLIQSKKITDESENLVVNYRLNLSKNFKTFVFTYNKGEMELFTTLVNYDNDYKFISKLDIAYDETAESWFRTESEISNKEIIVNKISYTEEAEQSTKTSYKIQKNGMIIKN